MNKRKRERESYSTEWREIETERERISVEFLTFIKIGGYILSS